MIRTTLIAILATLSFSCSGQKDSNYDVVIQNVGLFDGFIDRGIVNLAISADTIALITTESVVADLIIDGTNNYLVPGLINSHVHVTGPDNLKEALNSGIMAVIDLHQSSEERAANLRTYRDSLNHAYFMSSGFAATLAGGHPTQYGDIETISDSLSADQWVNNRLDNGADFIKIIRDAGGGPPDFKMIPTLGFDQIENIITSSKERDQLLIAHTVNLDETMTIASLGVDGLAHLWFGNESLTDEMLDLLAKTELFVIPTALTQSKVWGLVANGPPRIKEYAEQNLSSMEIVKGELLRLNQAGVKILAGNDPPNFGINYGDDLIEELLIYSDAGISNIEVLKTVTGNPSEEFGLKDIGRIEVGLAANLLLIEGNPIENLSHLKEIKQIWRNGEAIKQ